MPSAPDETPPAADLLALPLGRRTRELLCRYDLHPVKSLGQNFLVDDNLARKLADAALAFQPDEVLEIGPGLGALTLPLLQADVGVVACEKDRKLEAPLRELLGGFPRFELMMGDFLEVGEGAGGVTVALGNLPYYITTPILEKLFAWTPRLAGIVVTVQREVGDRILAQPGSKDYGSLTVFCRYHVASVETVARLGPSVFLPPPGISSVALRMVPREDSPDGVLSERAFFLGFRAAFGYRRKALRRALATAPELGMSADQADAALAAAGIDPMRRGETLSFEEFIALGNALHETGLVA